MSDKESLKPPVITKLDDMARVQQDLEHLRQAQEEKRKAILAPVQAQLDALDAQFGTQIEMLTETLTQMESSIKADVVALQESVKGTHLHAVYAKGRVSWNDDQLLGYAAAGHPEIKAFRSEGAPSVSMRKVTLKEAK